MMEKVLSFAGLLATCGNEQAKDQIDKETSAFEMRSATCAPYNSKTIWNCFGVVPYTGSQFPTSIHAPSIGSYRYV